MSNLPYPTQPGYPNNAAPPYPPDPNAQPPYGQPPPYAPTAPPAPGQYPPAPYPPGQNQQPYPQGSAPSPYPPPPAYSQQQPGYPNPGYPPQAPGYPPQSGYPPAAGAPGPYGNQQPSPGFLWSLSDKHEFLEVLGNGTEVFYSGRDHEIVEDEELGPIVKADRPIPKQGQFYFEVSIVNSGENNEIAVGICTKNSSQGLGAPLDRFPGWVQTSFGYHGDDGNIFCESEDESHQTEKPFQEGDAIGVLLDYNTRTLTFSKQRQTVKTIQLLDHHLMHDFYPCVGISSPGAIVRLAPPAAPPAGPPQQGFQQPQYPGYPPASGPPAGPPQQGYQQPQYPGYPPASQQSPYPQSQGTPDYPQQPAYPQQPQAGSTAPYPTNDQKGPGKGMFSGKGLLGQAMGMAEKYGAGGMVGQAAGALGLGGQGSGGQSASGQGGNGQGFLWSNQDKHQFLEVRGNGTEIYYSGRDHGLVERDELGPIVRADRPIPRQGQFHFEVCVENTGQNSEIAVGICTRSSPLDRFPGWVPMSFGFHGDDGNIFCESEDPAYEPNKPFKTGYLVGVTLDFNRSTLTFSRKQKEVQKIQLQSHHMNQEFYPCVGISSPGAVVRLTTPIGTTAPPPQAYQQPQYAGGYPAGPPEQAYPQSQGPAPSHGGLLSNCQGNKKALLIGINYFGQSGELRGCVNDVNNIKQLIMSRGFRESNMMILTDDQRDSRCHPTRQNIIEGMNWLVRGARPNDSLFFHYSGHGSQQQDSDGDEVDGTDETICPVDYNDAGQIVDDEMNSLLVQQLPRGSRLTAIFDSCHSATALDLPNIYDCNGQPKKQKYSRKTAGMDLLSAAAGLSHGNMFDKLQAGQQAFSTLTALGNEGNAQEITAQTRSSQADVVMFSGCKDNQTSADTNVSGYGATGAASYAFIDAVRNSQPNVTYADLLAIMRDTLVGKYSQKIQMSTGFPTDMNIPFIF